MPRHSQKNQVKWGGLFSLPAMLFFSAFFLLPLIALGFRSFFETTGAGAWTFSLATYQEIFTDPYHLGLMWRTVKLSAITTCVSLLLAFPVALHLRQMSSRMRALVTLAVLSPLLTSVIVRTLAWLVLLGPQGTINRALISIGWQPYQLMYNDVGVVIGLTHVFLGYMILSLMATLDRVDDNILLAASNLGANRWAVLWHVIIPLSLPGMLTGAVLVFTMSASTYATPVLLGGSKAKVLAAEIYDLAINYLEFGMAAGMAVVLLLGVASMVFCVTRYVEGGRRKVIFE